MEKKEKVITEKKTIMFKGKKVRVKKDGTINLTDLPKGLRAKYKEAIEEKKRKDDNNDLNTLLQMLD